MTPSLRIFVSVFMLLLSHALTADELGSRLQTKQALAKETVTYLQQNWTAADRQWFYYIDQGSRLLPYTIFIHLEQANSEHLLRDANNMLRYGFLPGKKSSDNTDGLAIGITKAEGYMGLTCAACHTQAFAYEDKFVHIDGGQAMIDLPLFLTELEAALQATLLDKDKQQRMATAIYGNEVSQTEQHTLLKQLTQAYEERRLDNARNQTSTKYGYGRLDAFGAILNKTLSLTQAKDNYNEPNAPTSYPYLWDTPQHDYVEWNGSQSNSNVGALARNVGEVIGVFGAVDTTPTSWLGLYDTGYASSVQAANLRAIEKHISTLQSPLWPEFFPAIDKNKAKQGRFLYEKYCQSCHQDIDRQDPERVIKVQMSTLAKIKTDPLMVENAIKYSGKSGIFAGRPRYYVGGKIMQAEEPAIFMLNNLMVGILKNNPLQAFLAKRDAKNLGHPEQIHVPKYVDGVIIESGQEVSDYALLAYKARPLNGVWSSAPFLHNGSVPNLYELLLPAEKRSQQFYISPWDYDPVKIGYVQDQQPGAFFFDTALPGNSNAGHEYGSGDDYDALPVLTDAQIWSLIEYLKTL